jgi:hypothetical protein
MKRLAWLACVATLGLVAVPSAARGQGATPPAAAVDTVVLPPSEIGTIAVGQTRRGRLEAGDYTMGDGTFADVWYVEGVAGQRLVITLRSRDFDSYLQLLDAAGDKVAEDDDSGGHSDARITYAVRTAGRYQIVVNNFADTPRPGAYTLEVTLAGR